MAYVPVINMAELGVVTDRLPHELPLNAWSGGKNVKFLNGYAETTGGGMVAYDPPSVPPYWLLSLFDASTLFVIYAGLEKVYGVSGTVHGNLTRQTLGVDVDYAATKLRRWSGGVLNGTPVLNNPNDTPQYWPQISLSTRLADLPDWPSGVRCGVMVPFLNFLVALDVTKGGTRYPQLVKWSHGADPGNLPVTWDETDPTHDAGEYPLADTPGKIVDAVQMGDQLIIYKEDATYSMQYVGGQFIFSFRKLFARTGALTAKCAVALPSGEHVVLAKDDIILHNGQQFQSIVEGYIRKELFASIDPQNYETSFLFLNTKDKEVWVCITPENEELPAKVWTWSWVTKSWGTRTLRPTAFLTMSVTDDTAVPHVWNQMPMTWNSIRTVWNDRTFNPAAEQVLAAQPLNTSIAVLGRSNLDFGETIETIITRTGIGLPFTADKPPDLFSQKFMRALRPRLEGTDGGEVFVRIGTQDYVDSPVEWRNEESYIIGVTDFIDILATGRLLAVSFRSNSAIEWRLHGYEVDVVTGGLF